MKKPTSELVLAITGQFELPRTPIPVSKVSN